MSSPPSRVLRRWGSPSSRPLSVAEFVLGTPADRIHRRGVDGPGTNARIAAASHRARSDRPDARETVHVLECAAMALAAQVMTDGQIAALRQTNELLRRSECQAMLPTARAVARSFHDRLIAACPNTHMVELFELHVGSSAPMSGRPLTANDVGRAADDHDRILAMIECGTPARPIERFLLEHVSDPMACCFAP